MLASQEAQESAALVGRPSGWPLEKLGELDFQVRCLRPVCCGTWNCVCEVQGAGSGC